MCQPQLVQGEIDPFYFAEEVEYSAVTAHGIWGEQGIEWRGIDFVVKGENTPAFGTLLIEELEGQFLQNILAEVLGVGGTYSHLYCGLKIHIDLLHHRDGFIELPTKSLQKIPDELALPHEQESFDSIQMHFKFEFVEQHIHQLFVSAIRYQSEPVFELLREEAVAGVQPEQLLRVQEIYIDMVLVITTLFEEVDGFASVEYHEGTLLVDQVGYHVPNDLVFVLPESRHCGGWIIEYKVLVVGVTEFSPIHPQKNKLQQRLDNMVEQTIQKLVDGGVALRPVGVENRDYLATLEGIDGLADNGQPFQPLEGLERPQHQLPQGKLLTLSHVLDQCYPPIVLVQFLSDGDVESVSDSPLLLYFGGDLFKQPPNIAQFSHYFANRLTYVDVRLERVHILLECNQVSRDVLHYEGDFSEDVSLGNILLAASSVSYREELVWKWPSLGVPLLGSCEVAFSSMKAGLLCLEGFRLEHTVEGVCYARIKLRKLQQQFDCFSFTGQCS